MHPAGSFKLICLLSLFFLLVNECEGARRTSKRPKATKKTKKLPPLTVCSNFNLGRPKMSPRMFVGMNNESLHSPPLDDKKENGIKNNSHTGHEESDSKIEARIWKGEAIPINRAPFMAVVMIRKGGDTIFRCNAAFITSRILVTAAHCFMDPNTRKQIDSRQFFVRYDTDKVSDAKRGQVAELERVVPHRKFSCAKEGDTHSPHDIAIVVLKQRVEAFRSDPSKLLKLPRKDTEKTKYIDNGHPLFIVSLGPSFPPEGDKFFKLKKQKVSLYAKDCDRIFSELLDPKFEPRRMLCNSVQDNLVTLGG